MSMGDNRLLHKILNCMAGLAMFFGCLCLAGGGRAFADEPPIYNVLPVVVECEGLGGLDDVGEEYFSLFNLMPGTLEFQGSYYDQLDDISKDLYDDFLGFYAEGTDVGNYNTVMIPVAIRDATIKWDDVTSFSVTDGRVQEIYRDYIVPAMLALMYDHPELPWLINSKYGGIIEPVIEGKVVYGQKTVNISGLTVKLSFTETNVGTKGEMDAAVETAKAVIGEKSLDYDILKGIHDYLADIIVYNNCAVKATNKVNNVSREYTNAQKDAYQTAYSAFYPCNDDDKYFGAGYNYTVCAGYARGFKLLCDCYGIPCIYVTGTGVGSTTEGHAWNYVLLEGRWYAVDCTWDDQADGIRDTYFLAGALSDGFNKKFSEEHIPSGQWIKDYDYTFFYPELAVARYCSHEDSDSDSVCDLCDMIIDAGLSVTQEGWVYGEDNPPAPSVTVANDSDPDKEYTFSYKKENDPDDSYSDEVPVNAGNYVVRVTLAGRYDLEYDYPESLAVAEFEIDKADLEVEAPAITGIPYKKGLKLSDISLEKYDWIWDDPDTEVGELQLKGDSVTKEYAAHYKLTDESNYNPVNGLLAVTFTPCGHENKKSVIATEPTCTDKGLVEYVCEYCGVKADAEQTDSLGHDFKWITDMQATTAESGMRHEECSRCHKRGREEVLPKLEEDNKSDKPGADKPGEDAGSQDPGNNDQKTDRLEKGSEHQDSNSSAVFVITGIEKDSKGEPVSAEMQYTEYKGNGTKVVIPDAVTVNGVTSRVTSIKAGALKNNKNITSVTIGKNVKSIGKNAFQNCPRLKTITIKSTNLKSIGKNALKNVSKKAVIKVPAKQLKRYKKLFNSKTGFKKTMKIKK